MSEQADGNGADQQKLAFTFQKKKVVQKVAVNVEERKDAGQLITGIEGSKLQVAGPDPAEDKLLVIPKLENTYKTGTGPKKFTPSFKPPSNDAVKLEQGEDKFVLGIPTAPLITEFGLQKREAPKLVDGEAGPSAGPRFTPAQLEERAYKEAVEELPEDPDLEAYESMPIEEFGKAMLRGMGWQEGMGVGRNRKVVEAIEYIKRPERLGLGAAPALLPDDKSKPVKMGDKPRRQDLVLPPDADGRQRNVRSLDEKLVPRAQVAAGPVAGKAMVLTGGRHSGLTCTVLVLLPKQEGRADRVRVRLTVSQEEVEVLAKELGERWEQPPRDQQQQQQGEDGGGSGRGAQRSNGGSAELDGQGREGRAGGSGRDSRGRHGDDGAARKAPGRHRSEERERHLGRDRDAERGRERDRRGDDEGEGRRPTSGDKRSRHEADEAGGSKRSRSDKDRERGDREEHANGSGRYGGSDSRRGRGDDDGDPRGAGPSWLYPRIKVRIVDKSACGGRLYLKKGTVVDVHPGGGADVVVDDTRDVVKFPESSLETVVPKAEGSAVLVVSGPLRGAKARLLQCRTADGVAAVQLAADFSVQRLMLDQVAQYCGPMDEDDE